MCSQECSAKMKILCLNTIQMLLKDAFDKFSSNLSANNITSNIMESKINLNEINAYLNARNESTICSSTSLEKPSTSNENQNSPSCSTSCTCENLQNQENNQLPNRESKETIPQLIMCNLMQNLVDVINEQCLKQLPDQFKIEKKKRKRKRKRKKSKRNDDLVTGKL